MLPLVTSTLVLMLLTSCGTQLVLSDHGLCEICCSIGHPCPGYSLHGHTPYGLQLLSHITVSIKYDFMATWNFVMSSSILTIILVSDSSGRFRVMQEKLPCCVWFGSQPLKILSVLVFLTDFDRRFPSAVQQDVAGDDQR